MKNIGGEKEKKRRKKEEGDTGAAKNIKEKKAYEYIKP